MRQSSFGENGNPRLENFLFALRAKKIIKALKAAGRFESIADLGCGYHALLLKKIVAAFPEIKKAVGLDLSVPIASNNDKIQFIKADLSRRLPLPDESFDALACSAVIEHLIDYRTFIGECRRALKPGGCLVLTSPAPALKCVLEFLAFRLGWLNQEEISDHKRYFSAGDLKKISGESGFRDIKIKTFQFGLNNLLIAKK